MIQKLILYHGTNITSILNMQMMRYQMDEHTTKNIIASVHHLLELNSNMRQATEKASKSMIVTLRLKILHSLVKPLIP